MPCGLPQARCGYGDPVTATAVLGRAWWRWETGRPFNVDERVFPPYPNTWGLSDGYPLEAAVGWPFARLLGSAAAGYNVPFFLGCALATLGAGLLLSRLAGPGWPALLGALLFSWGPARLNNLGVLDTVWAGTVPLGLFFALRYFDAAKKRDALLWAAVWLALGLVLAHGEARAKGLLRHRADLMKRIAAPMVGGLVTSFALDLLVYPAVWFSGKSGVCPD